MRTLRYLLLTSVGAAAVGAPMLATADSGFGASTASADLDFQIVIPDYVYLEIGSAGNVVDLVTFTLDPATNFPGSGNPVPGDTPIGVTLVSNSNDVTINAVGVGGGIGPIGWPEILIDNSTGTTDIDVPAIDGASSASMNPGAAAGLTLTDTWTFSFTNANAYAPGTYGGPGVGTVTFTATAL